MYFFTFLCGRPVFDFLKPFHVWHWLGIMMQLVRIELWYRHHKLWDAPFWLDITIRRQERRIHVWLRPDPDWDKFKRPEAKPWERLDIAALWHDPGDDLFSLLSEAITPVPRSPYPGATDAEHPFAPP